MTTLPARIRFQTRTLFGQPGLMMDASRVDEAGTASPVSRIAFFEALVDDDAFREALMEAFLRSEWPAVAWETAPISQATRQLPMSQCVLPHPALARSVADIGSFAEHLDSGKGSKEVRSFLNWGSDARLVVPCAPRAGIDYAHLLPFLKNAPVEQRHQLFRETGLQVLHHLDTSEAPVWVSTAGLGVSWLHIRLDQKPKYYRTDAFRSVK